MRRPFGLFLCLTLLLAVICQTGTKSASANTEEDEHLRRTLAVNLLRSISTAEHQYHAKHGNFADWTALVGTSEYANAVEVYSRNPKYAALRNTQKAAFPQVLENWDLRLNVGADGQTYDLTMSDTLDRTCRFSIFSNEKGLIWQGRTIDCRI